MKSLYKMLLVVAMITGLLISCDNDENNIPEGQGAVTVKITDDPFPFNFVAKANIGVAKVELKNSSGDYVVVFEGSSNYNMVGLTNGTTEIVASTNIEVGTYNQARVTLDDASVELSNGTIFDMGAAAQGSYTINIEPALEVEEGDFSEVLFDLDINDSFQFQGAWMGDWITNISSIIGCDFEADFRACDLDQTGRIEGFVTATGAALENAYVYIESDGVSIATQTEANGSFVLIGLEEGTYTVYVETEANGSMSVSDIEVTVSNSASCTIEL